MPSLGREGLASWLEVGKPRFWVDRRVKVTDDLFVLEVVIFAGKTPPLYTLYSLARRVHHLLDLSSRFLDWEGKQARSPLHSDSLQQPTKHLLSSVKIHMNSIVGKNDTTSQQQTGAGRVTNHGRQLFY